MSCKLCFQNRPLRRSHVIPEFLWTPLYDEKHRARQLTLDSGQMKYIQKGHREPMLCENCEQQIGRYERYFKQAWYDEGRLPSEVEQAEHLVSGLDYDVFKLFHLSILWRASVSASSTFDAVHLGPHAELIRQMLLAEDPGDVSSYHFVAQVLVLDGPVMDGIIMEPASFKHDNRHIYVFLFGGCAWNYVVSKEPLLKFMPLGLTKTGDLRLQRQQLSQFDLVSNFVVDYVRRGGTDF